MGLEKKPAHPKRPWWRWRSPRANAGDAANAGPRRIAKAGPSGAGPRCSRGPPLGCAGCPWSQ